VIKSRQLKRGQRSWEFILLDLQHLRWGEDVRKETTDFFLGRTVCLQTGILRNWVVSWSLDFLNQDTLLIDWWLIDFQRQCIAMVPSWPWTPELKQLSCPSLPSRWNYRYVSPHPTTICDIYLRTVTSSQMWWNTPEFPAFGRLKRRFVSLRPLFWLKKGRGMGQSMWMTFRS
jgi:hypothetical protein